MPPYARGAAPVPVDVIPGRQAPWPWISPRPNAGHVRQFRVEALGRGMARNGRGRDSPIQLPNFYCGAFRGIQADLSNLSLLL